MLDKRIVAALAVSAICGSAFGQSVTLTSNQETQLVCINDLLVAGKADASIARVYARGDNEGQEYEANINAMDKAMVACQLQHKWSDEQTNLAAEIALFQIVLDNFSRTLGDTPGITETAFEQIGAALTATPQADQRLLMAGGWRDNAGLMKRMSDRLIVAGLPGDPKVFAYALLIMESKLVVTYGTMDWAKLNP